MRLKGSGNYGSTLKFGDGSYCYISESTDDDMKIYADSVDIVTKNGAEVKVDGNTSNSTVYLTANKINTSAKVSTLDNTGQLNLNGNSVCVNDWFSVGLKNLQSSDAIT